MQNWKSGLMMPTVPRRHSCKNTAVFLIAGIWLVLSGAQSRGDDAKSAANPRRTAAQIIADIDTSVKAIPGFPLAVELNPIYKQQMQQQVAPGLQSEFGFIKELQGVDPARASNFREESCLVAVRLALYGSNDALQSLTESSNSNVASEAMVGKIGLMMYRWWNSADAQTQGKIFTEFKALAKANPKEDLLVSAALSMARYQSNSDDLSRSLRDLVDTDLNGAAAIKYHHQLYKIGRPFKVTVNVIGGKSVSTANWRSKVVLIDFWATWCPPCVAAVPNLIKDYQDDHSKGLEILGISNDSSLPALRQFLADHQEMAWPQSFKPTGPTQWNELSPQMGIEAIPTAFLIDRNGILRDIEVAYLDEVLLKKLLDETPDPSVAAASAPPSETKTGPAPGPATQPTPTANSGVQSADSLLALAKSYIDAGRPDRARDKLTQLLEKYPGSEAAPKAKELLESLNGQ